MKASVFKLMFFPSTAIFSVSLICEKADPRQLADRKIICPILSRALRLKEMIIDITIHPCLSSWLPGQSCFVIFFISKEWKLKWSIKHTESPITEGRY